MRQIVLTEEEANLLLNILAELPIKYLPIVQQVQATLTKKFDEATHEPAA